MSVKIERREAIGLGLLGLAGVCGALVYNWSRDYDGSDEVDEETVFKNNAEALNRLGLWSFGEISFDRSQLDKIAYFGLQDHLYKSKYPMDYFFYGLLTQNPIKIADEATGLEKRNTQEELLPLTGQKFHLGGIFLYGRRAVLLIAGMVPHPDNFGNNPDAPSVTPGIGLVDTDVKNVSGLVGGLDYNLDVALNTLSRNYEDRFDMASGNTGVIVSSRLTANQKLKTLTRYGWPVMANDPDYISSVQDAVSSDPDQLLVNARVIKGLNPLPLLGNTPFYEVSESQLVDTGRVVAIKAMIPSREGNLILVNPKSESVKPGAFYPREFNGRNIDLEMRIFEDWILMPISDVVGQPDGEWRNRHMNHQRIKDFGPWVKPRGDEVYQFPMRLVRI